MAWAERLQGKHVLVVEDDFLIATDLAAALEQMGAHIIGPAGTITTALHLIENSETLDGAVLDLNVRGQMSYPVADVLTERGVRFVFTTGYDRSAVDPRFSHVSLYEKPIDVDEVARSLSIADGHAFFSRR